MKISAPLVILFLSSLTTASIILNPEEKKQVQAPRSAEDLDLLTGIKAPELEKRKGGKGKGGSSGEDSAAGEGPRGEMLSLVLAVGAAGIVLGM